MEFLTITICLVILVHVPLSAIVVYDAIVNSKRPFRLLWALLILLVPYIGSRIYFQSMKRKKRPVYLKQIVDLSLWGVRESKYDKSFRQRKVANQNMFY